MMSDKHMKGTVVIIASIPWHFTWQVEHNMAVGFASRGYRVLFVEALPKRWPRPEEFSRVWGRLTGDSVSAGFCRQPMVPGIELSSPRMLPDAGNITRTINRSLFVPGLANRLSQSVERPLFVINDLPTSASLALMRSLKPDIAIYHCVYNWPDDPYAPYHDFEAEMARAVDQVWADSPVNIARTRTMTSNVAPLHHGVNFELFAQAQRDAVMPSERPLCAYFGSIHFSLDFELLRAVSHRYRLRLIGPVRVDLKDFPPETEIVGAVDHEQLPALLRDVDVLLLPYAHTEHNTGVMPAKLFECLATGKPTVACGLPTLYDYASLFYIRETHEAFLAAIAEAAHEPVERQVARIACAEEHSYERRTDKIEGYLRDLMIEKGIRTTDLNGLAAS
jgi:glycosyltransferase involved in cell wall biosynthesis